MPAEVISRWIDAQPEGALIRTRDVVHLVHRDQAPRVLARLVKHGKLMRVARGLYVAVKVSRFGPVPPPVNKMVDALTSITGHVIVRHGAVAANALGLTTQFPIRQIYLTDGRARTLNLGKQVIEIRHAPAWMWVLGDCLAGDAVRALEWLGPNLAGQAIAKLLGRTGQDDWRAMLKVQDPLPGWMGAAIQQGLAMSAGGPFGR